MCISPISSGFVHWNDGINIYVNPNKVSCICDNLSGEKTSKVMFEDGSIIDVDIPANKLFEKNNNKDIELKKFVAIG